jgi:DNA helicase HerA-like ATPase
VEAFAAAQLSARFLTMSEILDFARASGRSVGLLPQMANRHGIVAGATGTGKTVSLQRLAEGFSARGVPVFMADVKGDLAGLSAAGGASTKVADRVRQLGLTDFQARGYPVAFWDLFGLQGHPVRATVTELGPMLLSRLLQLNEIQEGVLHLVFRIADEHGLLLLDLKDLRAVLKHVGENASAFTTEYGNISAASIGAIQRGLLTLESQGGASFFGEPALNLEDLLQTDSDGRGIINILAADRLMQSPRVYATALLWLLSELFERLPEAGDLPQPKLVFFFDEAHLLFNGIAPALLEKVEQVVRLIRSKGVGVYFVTQNPRDIPDRVLGQLGNRVQHALRAFTPADQKLVRAAAQTFRANPSLNTETVLTELAVGEALVSFLDESGQPGVVERALVLPPESRVGPISDAERRAVLEKSLVAGVYEQVVDRESAYERLAGVHAAVSGNAETPAPAPAKKGFFSGWFGDDSDSDTGSRMPSAPASSVPLPTKSAPRRGGRTPDSLGEVFVKTATRSLATAVVGTLSREIMRGLLGGSRRR